MDVTRAFDDAFGAGLKVRGDAPKAVASASLVMHAARTLDPAPFWERGEALVGPAMDSFRKAGRADLELRVAMWLADGGREVPVSGKAEAALDAYRKARAWGAGEGGPENLVWIRDVPREESLSDPLLERLFDHALAAGERAKGPAQAVLEAALADFPKPERYGLIFRAAALAGAPEVIDRTLEGLTAAHPSHDNPAGRAQLARLRAALAVERMEAESAAVEAAVLAMRDVVLEADLGAHLAAALHRKLLDGPARDLLGTAGKAEAVCSAFVARQLAGSRPERDSTSRRLLATPERPSAPALVAGGCEAARALRAAWPAVDVAGALMGDSLGPLTTGTVRAGFQKELFAVGGEAAAATGDRAAVEAMARTLRSGALSPSSETFLRALLADAAAGVAARAGDAKAYDFAQKLASQTRDKFERAKMVGRAAMEYVRASEVPPMPVRWLDPGFGTLA